MMREANARTRSASAAARYGRLRQAARARLGTCRTTAGCLAKLLTRSEPDLGTARQKACGRLRRGPSFDEILVLSKMTGILSALLSSSASPLIQGKTHAFQVKGGLLTLANSTPTRSENMHRITREV
jgi:hypothetical protein